MYPCSKFKEFMVLVDECLAYNYDYSDKNYIESFLNSKLETSKKTTIETLYTKVKATTVTNKKSMTTNLRQIESSLYRMYHYNNGEGYAYHKIPAKILFSVNEDLFTTLDDRESWINAIHATLIIMALDSYDTWGQKYTADIPITNAALRIKARGFTPLFNGRHFYLNENESATYHTLLDNKMRDIGGTRFISLLLRNFQRINKYFEGRYLLGRPEYPIVANGDFMPGLPYGYLIHLALRHMEKKTTYCNEQNFDSLLVMAQDWVGMLDIQDYSQFGSMFVVVQSLPNYISRTMLADSCLSFRQLSPDAAILFMEELFVWVDNDKMKSELGWDIKDALKIVKTIAKRVPDSSVNCLIPIEELRRNCGLEPHCITKLLPYFIHKTTEINKELKHPTDWEKVNFHEKPLIWQPGNKVLLVAKSLTFLAFYEALVLAIKTFERNCDNEIGNHIEPMVGKLFERASISPTAIARKFIVEGTEYESDLIIESDNVIILGEIKKKGLTRPSMAGDAVDGIIDLVLTFIKAQTQLAIQEIQLLKNGFIQFSDGQKLLHNGRRIERIAITLHDLGSVQDRMIAGNIIKTLINSVTTADHATPYQKRRLAECNDLTALLNDQTRQIISLNKNGSDPLFDCTFLGVPQIQFLLNGVKSVDEFHSNLRTVKTSVRASFDMYDTFVNTQRIRKQAKLEQEAKVSS